MKALIFLCITLMLCIGAANAASTEPQPKTDRMSAMGQRAAAAVAKLKQQTTGKGGPEVRTRGADDGDDCLNKPDAPSRATEKNAPRADRPSCRSRSMRAVSTSSSASTTRAGFDKNPISVSGYMYSEDGGKTFVDGGSTAFPGQ